MKTIVLCLGLLPLGGFKSFAEFILVWKCVCPISNKEDRSKYPRWGGCSKGVCVCVCVCFLISVLYSWLPGTCRWQIFRVCCDIMTIVVVVVIHASWWKAKVHCWMLLVIVHHDELVLFFVSLLSSSSFLQFLHSGVDHPNGYYRVFLMGSFPDSLFESKCDHLLLSGSQKEVAKWNDDNEDLLPMHVLSAY